MLGTWSTLTNSDSGNFKANNFVQGGYRARIGDVQGALTKLRDQVFHLGKKRQRDVVGKFNTEHAKKVHDWVEENFGDFLSKLAPIIRESWRLAM